jgi:Flp pilus assembly CpaF family ATPase
VSNLPARRKTKASIPDAFVEDEALSSKDIVTEEDAKRFQEAGVSEARALGGPEEQFERWQEIIKQVKAEFIRRSKGSGEAAIREENAFYEMVSEIIMRSFPEIPPIELPRLVDLLRSHLFGYGNLEKYMAIDDLEEIYFNRYDQGFFIAGGTKYKIKDHIFQNKEQMRIFLDRVASENGLELNLQNPILDAALSDGSRLNASIEPIAVDGADFIIRKHRDIPFTIEQFLEEGVLSPQLARDIETWVRTGFNFIVSGSTASGKTSFLNTIAKSYMPRTDRVLILENRKELQIKTDDCKYFQTREDATNPGSGDNEITLEVLVRSTLRKRPRRIIVGEIRGREAYDALEAWNTGHEGSFCTIHANSAPEAISRLESLAARAGTLDAQGVRNLIAGAVDIVIQLNLDPLSGKRSVTEVIQVLHDFKYDRSRKDLRDEVDGLKNEGSLRHLREEIEILTLYRRKEGTLVKENNPIPIQGRGPQRS